MRALLLLLLLQGCGAAALYQGNQLDTRIQTLESRVNALEVSQARAAR